LKEKGPQVCAHGPGGKERKEERKIYSITQEICNEHSKERR
jgi:hypothetical protein